MDEATLSHVHEFDEDDLPTVFFCEETLRLGLRFSWYANWSVDPNPTGIVLTADDITLKASHRLSGGDTSIYRIEQDREDSSPALLRVRVRSTRLDAQVVLDRFDVATADAVFARLLKAYPKQAPKKTNEIQVTFRFLSNASGPLSYNRMMEVPSWADVRGNYSARVAAELDSLLAPTYRPSRGGQLFLLHGEPGSGKTYLIRALGSEWRAWCKLEYIVDPEQFFGDSSYMMQILLDHDEGAIATPESDDDDGGEPSLLLSAGRRWRLLLLEDAGELLAADAKQRTGQGLSRLLNVSEGLIGQGLRIMLLITTNEALGDLHPAVQRPGRAALQLEFDRLSADEANAWLDTHGCAERVSKSSTVAELYNMITKQKARKSVRRGKTTGFGARRD